MCVFQLSICNEDMPRQSRGFWTCDFCQATFHTPDEATFHENFICHRRPPAAQHEGLYSETTESAQRQPPAPAGSPQIFPLPGSRRFLLLGQDSGRLTREDASTCRNVEIFEVDTPNTTDATGAPLAMGTVGLRCIHCIGDPTAASGNAIFPRSIPEIGDCVRDIAEGHLWRCGRTPSHVRQLLEQALTARRQAKQEQGRAWFHQENSRGLLVDHCVFVARELSLIDRYPVNSGVMFPPNEMMPPPQHPGALFAEGGTSAPPLQQSARETGNPSNIAAASPIRPIHDPSEYDQQAPFGSPPFGPPFHQDDETGTPEPLPFPPGYHPGAHQGPSSADNTRQSHDPRGPYEQNVPVHFPFVREPSGNWVCKFCQHVPAQFRNQHFQWPASHKKPPPGDFIDRHLNICRMYQQSLMQDFHRPAPATHNQTLPPFHQDQPDPGGLASEFEQFTSPFAHVEHESHNTRDLKADTPLNRAMAHLDAHDLSLMYSDGTLVPEQLKLVVNDDRLLLTDYYYYLMKQLRHCRFAETDRKTRGGKRDAIAIGYGGLQCVHCAKMPNARKFFWGSVDRLANSFAEIPTHILKCRACPRETQDALQTLKEKHSEQMSRLPRGSQKVYFRRMWRRIHDHEHVQQQPTMMRPSHQLPTNSPPAAAHMSPPERLHPFTTEKLSSAMGSSPGGESVGSEESILFMERDPAQAARALVDYAIHAGPPSPSSRVLLAIPNDREWLSDTDIFIRQQVEVFCATVEDVAAAAAGNKFPIDEGTVGIRCIHCAISRQGATENHTLYPFSISGLYEAAQEFPRLHLDHCKNISPAAAAKLASLKGNSSLPSVARDYYVRAARSLGLVDTKNGIRASGQSVPFVPSFTFSEPMKSSTGDDPIKEASKMTPRKRSLSQASTGMDESKRQARLNDDNPAGVNVTGYNSADVLDQHRTKSLKQERNEGSSTE